MPPAVPDPVLVELLGGDEVVYGLTWWAGGQHREGLFTAAEHTTVLALVGDGRPPA